MCLAVPMKVEKIEDHRAYCSALGQERWADLTLVEDGSVVPGDYVIIHLGFVQRTVGEEEALESIELFKEILDKVPE